MACLRLAARMDIVCITTPCITPETVLAQGQKWSPPGRATYDLPLILERNDTVGNWLIEATVGGTQAQARFQIVAYVATYGNDQLDLGEVGTGPYRLSVHR